MDGIVILSTYALRENGSGLVVRSNDESLLSGLAAEHDSRDGQCRGTVWHD